MLFLIFEKKYSRRGIAEQFQEGFESNMEIECWYIMHRKEKVELYLSVGCLDVMSTLNEAEIRTKIQHIIQNTGYILDTEDFNDENNIVV